MTDELKAWAEEKAVENYKQTVLTALEKEFNCNDECAKKFYEGLGCKACYWNRIKEIVEKGGA